MTLRERWIDLLYRAATGVRRTRALLTPVGLIMFGGFTALFVVVALVVDRLLGLTGLLPEATAPLVSAPLIALATFFVDMLYPLLDPRISYQKGT